MHWASVPCSHPLGSLLRPSFCMFHLLQSIRLLFFSGTFSGSDSCSFSVLWELEVPPSGFSQWPVVHKEERQTNSINCTIMFQSSLQDLKLTGMSQVQLAFAIPSSFSQLTNLPHYLWIWCNMMPYAISNSISGPPPHQCYSLASVLLFCPCLPLVWVPDTRLTCWKNASLSRSSTKVSSSNQ